MRVQRFQSRGRNMRIDLSCRDIAVPEQHLDDAKVGAVIEQVRGECVAQCVWRHISADAGPERIFLD